MTTPALLVERDGAVETWIINGAPWNRVTLECVEALEQAVARVASDATVRAIVLRGAGTDHFSVGMDLRQLDAGIAAAGSVDAFFDRRLDLLDAIEHLPKPVVAVMNGYCLGAGLELPLACHFRVAAERGARIGLPEMELGTVPAWGGSARLARCVGRHHALDMILRARTVSGPEAWRIGLVTEVFPQADLFQRAHAFAQDLADKPARAVAAMLRALVGHEGASLNEALDAERAAVHATLGSPDQLEGMHAFLEKRPPRFNQEPRESGGSRSWRK